MKTGPTICWTESHAVLVDQPVASVCICIYVFHNNYYGVIMTPSSVFTMCLCVCVCGMCHYKRIFSNGSRMGIPNI